MVGAWLFVASCASGINPAPAPFFGCHWYAPAGLLVSSHSNPKRFSKKIVAPLRRRLRPGHFEPRTDRVSTQTRAETTLPPQSLFLNACGLRLSAHLARRPGAVRLAKAMSTGNQRHRLLIVHCHARKGLANVARRGHRIGIAIGAFRVHVDQAHLHRSQRIRQLAIAAVALVAQPRRLRTPIRIKLRLPNIRAPAAEAKRLEAHRLERHVPGQDDQICPRNLLSVLLFDRPQQPPRLVQIHVVRPAVQWRKTLRPAARAATPIGNAVGAGGVPCHADEQPSVVPEVSGPPRLRIGHQCAQILDHRIEIQSLEFLGVVKRLAHGIG